MGDISGGIIFFAVSLIIVSYFWFRYEKSVVKSVILMLYFCLTFYLNAPNFLAVVDGTKVSSPIMMVVFNIYHRLGYIYIIISNLLTIILGVMIGKSSTEKASYNSSRVKKQFDAFVLDATELKIIGKDLDFLCDNCSDLYKTQKEKIKNLGMQAMLLCEWTDNPELIELYNELLKNGNRVRSYKSRSDIANLKGQIKHDENNKKQGLFVTKIPEVSNMLSRTELFGHHPFKKKQARYNIKLVSDSYFFDALEKLLFSGHF